MADRSAFLSRRRFLFAAGAGGVGAAAARRGKEETRASTPALNATRRTGYRRTAHIGNYYRTARF